MTMTQNLMLCDNGSIDKIWEAYYKVRAFLFRRPNREIKFSDGGTIKNPENLKLMLNNVELVLKTQKLKSYYFSAEIRIEK